MQCEVHTAIMRRAVPTLLAVFAVAAVLWVAAPRLMDQFAPVWTVTATMPTAAPEATVRAVDRCFEVPVLGSARVLTDVESGRVRADLQAVGWDVGRVKECLRGVAGLTSVRATRVG